MSDCILWTRGQTDGYGQSYRDGRTITAHRAAWLDSGRELLPGHDIHHTCGVRLCVNIEHLVQLTKAEHTQLHQPNPPKLICDKCGSDRKRFSASKTYRCLTCHNKYQRAKRLKAALGETE